jgi:ATP-binding protein involved in chromosome partitioning
VALTLSQMVSLAGAVVVCTPQQVALLDAGKAITMFNTVKVPILGMVENMTGEVFGRGGAKAKAAAMGISFLGEIASDPIIRIRGDEGRIGLLLSEENPVRPSLLDISSRVAMAIAKQLLESPALPTLELL